MNFQISEYTSQMLRHASLILFAVLLHSCQYSKRSSYINEAASVSIPEMPFDIEQGYFLSQYTNPSPRITSWVMADSGFIRSQALASFFTVSGEGKLCILHWSQTDDPVWIGARIPGRFLWADLITYESDTLVIKQYGPNGMVVAANESYKREVEGLLKEINVVSCP
jgi:hypothetical protein